MAAALTVLFCADPLAPSRVDPHFAHEAAAVRELGGAVAFVDHDALTAGDTSTAVRRVAPGLGHVWYRGWMITSSGYQALTAALDERNVALHTTPEQYRTAHEFPGWYPAFAQATPASVWMPAEAGTPPSAAEVAQLIEPLGPGPGIVKDYVKSRKHEWEHACYIPDLTDIDSAAKIVARMVQLQEEALNGGIVIRRFERFQHHDQHALEARVWWRDGTPVAIGAHPDNPPQQPVPEPDLHLVVPLVAALDCRWITTDVALRDDGQWRVIEVGDAQVSGWPQHSDATSLFRPLAHASAA